MLPYYQNPHDVTRLPAWQQLAEHRQAMGTFSLRPATPADRSLVLLTAAHLGSTRLIDNLSVTL